MNYSFKVNNISVTYRDAKKAIASFLWYQQNGYNPMWTVFPGEYEVVDFYTVNDIHGNFITLAGKNKIAMFDSYDEADECLADLLSEKRYAIFQGCVTPDGLIAGFDDPFAASIFSEEYNEMAAEEEKKEYIETIKRYMKILWNEYDAVMKRGEDVELDDEYFMYEMELKGMCVEYNPSKE